MLALESPRWSQLRHAYGSAADTPELLRRVLNDPEEDDWDDLFGTLTHQGDVSTAAYAAVPHIVRSALGKPPDQQPMYWSFVSSVARHGQPSALDEDIARAYHEALSLAGPAILRLLKGGPCSATNAVYLLEAAAAVHGHLGAAWCLDGLADGEFTVECPSCSSWIYVWPDTDGESFVARSEDPVKNPSAQSTRVQPAPEPAASQDSNSAYPWLFRLARGLPHPGLRHGLRAFFGTVTCPRCAQEFQLSEELIRQSRSPAA